MLLYTGFMNGVTSRFVPNLCSDQGNKVGRAPPTKKYVWFRVEICPEKLQLDQIQHGRLSP